MFNKEQLELLDALFNEDDFAERNSIPAETVSALRGACHSALWTTTRPLPRSDDALAKQAIADGRLQIFGPAKIGEPEGVTHLRSRLMPEVMKVKTGEALLAALHLRSATPKPSGEAATLSQDVATLSSMLETPMSDIVQPDQDEEAA